MPQSQRSPSSTASRREFLKTSAVGMAAASGLPLARSAHAAGSEAIKIGMLGCGGRCSGAAAQALSLGKDVKLAGMNDVFEKRMRGRKEYFKTRFPDQFIATDETCTYGLEGYKKVIEASDAVLIAVRRSTTRSTRRKRSRPASTSSWKNRTRSTRPAAGS